MDNIREERGGHVHNYYGRTTADLDHFHVFEGTTGLNYETGPGHIHRFGNETSRAHSHTHRMYGNSSQQVPTFWGHVHQIAGVTTFEDGHTHRFDVLTGPAHKPRTRRPRLMSSSGALPENQGEQLRHQATSPRRRRRLFLKTNSSSQKQ